MTTIDYVILATYLAVVLCIGILAGRRDEDADDLFVGGRRMPAWAVGISVIATAVSGATFIGGPQAAYAGNLTYLSASIGSVLGAVLVAWLLLPKFHAAGASTVYEVIGNARGGVARKACAIVFLLGRLLASGTRLYVAAIPCSLITFGDLAPYHLVLCIAVFAIAAMIYTAWGGIGAVIWTDVLQAGVLVLAVTASLLVLSGQLPMSFGEGLERLGSAGGDTPKLTLFDTRLDVTAPFAIWAVVLGLTLFNAAAFGTDQDLAQRLLTSKDSRSAAKALVGSSLAGIGLVALFMTIGLLLFLRDDAAGVMSTDTRGVYLEFIRGELPVGLRGLLVAGLLAAAMSSTDSALASMSSSLVLDLKIGPPTGTAARVGNVLCGSALAVVASIFALASAGEEGGLLPFALGVMVYAYAGLLGVFVGVLLLNRGSAGTVVAALVVGAASVYLMQFHAGDVGLPTPSLGWRMLGGFLLSLAVCCLVPARLPPGEVPDRGFEPITS